MLASVVGRRALVQLRSDGTRLRSGGIRLVHRDGLGELRLAFAIGRNFGSAVERNRARRRLREAFTGAAAALDEQAPTGDLLISCSRSVLRMPFPMLVRDARELLERINHGS